MNGLMMDYPLTLQHIFHRMSRLYADKSVVSKTPTGTERCTYGELAGRVTRLSRALELAGVRRGDRVATFAFNNQRHLECYFAIPCMGAVLHTLNVRLFRDQLEYIIADADDTVIFVDRSALPLLAPLAGHMPSVKLLVLMGSGPAETDGLAPWVDYEEFLASADRDVEFPALDEREACSMCYTSGTTGDPKGVVYSHRSTLLHAITACIPDCGDLSEADTVLPVVPMFHANAWGFCHSAPLIGANLAFADRFTDARSLLDLMLQERVTVSAGVPTIWNALVAALDASPVDLPDLRHLICGGSAVPVSLLEAMDRHGLQILQAWGMTETSPIGTFCRPRHAHTGLSPDALRQLGAKQGYRVPGIDLRVVDVTSRQEVSWDGESVGEIEVRGPWVASSYYHGASAERFRDGWFSTGDVATIDALGYIQIVDRTKDLIKSGGEWISSVELEGRIMAHPKVFEAAVIGIADAKWGERPLAYVVPLPEHKDNITSEEIIEFLRPQVAKFWLPDAVQFIDSVPKTSVGKFDKKVLRTKPAEDIL